MKVAVRIENRSQAARDVTVRIRLADPGGSGRRHARGQAVDRRRRQRRRGARLHGGRAAAVVHERPRGSTAPRSRCCPSGTVTDRVATPFGIRKVEVDAERGLRINGEPVKLKGGCLHHDNGLLGSCAIDRAEERRVELMKAHGFNAIRTSHNPPVRRRSSTPATASACSSSTRRSISGSSQKNAQDYHLYFADWWQRDLDAMVLRDRNHPSVIMWSIGNEIPERAQPRGVEIAKQLIGYIRIARPDAPDHGRHQRRSGGGEGLDPAFEHLDIGGYNYLAGLYETDHARHPDRVIVGLESFPQQAFQSWLPAEMHPYVIGDFVWTGMDHLGESSIGNAQLNTPARRGGAGAGAAAARLPGEAGGRREELRRLAAAARCPQRAAGPQVRPGGRNGGAPAPSGLAACSAAVQHQPAVPLVQLLLRRHRPHRPAQAAVVPPPRDLGTQQARDGCPAAGSARAARRSSAPGAGPTSCAAGPGPGAKGGS